jgi:acyl transferase domain-containing protein
VAEFVFDYAFASLWKAWLGEPACVAGRGLGRLTAACAAGATSVSDTVKVLHAPGEDIHRLASEIPFSKPRCALLSGSTGEPLSDSWSEGDGWRMTDVVGDGADPACAALAQQADTVIQVGAASSGWNATHVAAADGKCLALGGLPDSGCPWRHILGNLARAYMHGLEVNWQAFYDGCSGRRIALPTYPFQRKRFWSPPVAFRPERPWVACESEPPARVHPVLGRRLYSALHPEAHVFETVLPSGSVQAVARRLRKLVEAAADWISAAGPVQQDDFVLHHLPDGHAQQSHMLQLTLLPETEDRIRLRIFSRTDPEGPEPATWTEHVSVVFVRSNEMDAS